MTGSTNYDSIISMIKAYENKYNKKMTVSQLVAYVQASKQIKMERAKEYIKDLSKMEKIVIGENRTVEIIEKGDNK